jgi:hypothetical protein
MSAMDALSECYDLWAGGAWDDRNAVYDLAEVMDRVGKLLGPDTPADPSRFWTMPADPGIHPMPFNDATWAVVDEEAGGINAYVNGRDLADRIAAQLNA